jgi:hypothetical protein
MNLIDENSKVVDKNDKGNSENLFWVYDLNETDFFLKKTDKWINLSTDSYVINIKGNEIEIPVNYYIIIGDYDGGLDTIRLSEIVGRPFDAFVLDTSLKKGSWSLENISIVGYKQNSNFIIPSIRALYLISISDKKCIIISEKEIYNKLKHLSFSDFL